MADDVAVLITALLVELQRRHPALDGASIRCKRAGTKGQGRKGLLSIAASRCSRLAPCTSWLIWGIFIWLEYWIFVWLEEKGTGMVSRWWFWIPFYRIWLSFSLQNLIPLFQKDQNWHHGKQLAGSLISGNSGLPEPEPKIAGTRIVGFPFFWIIFGFHFSKLEFSKTRKARPDFFG